MPSAGISPGSFYLTPNLAIGVIEEFLQIIRTGWGIAPGQTKLGCVQLLFR
jgi:hypothetical protein